MLEDRLCQTYRGRRQAEIPQGLRKVSGAELLSAGQCKVGSDRVLKFGEIIDNSRIAYLLKYLQSPTSPQSRSDIFEGENEESRKPVKVEK